MPQAAFHVLRKRLLEAVRRVEAAASKRSPKPILQCVRLSVNGAVSLSATDQEFAVVESLDAESQGAADILLSPQRLKDALSRTKEEQVRVEIAQDDSATLVCGNARFTIPCAERKSRDFPQIGGVDQIVGYIKGADLARGLRQTVPFCDEDSSRYALGGVLFEIGRERITLVATDTRRMAFVAIPYVAYKGESQSRTGVLPAILLRTVLKHAEAHPAVELRLNDKAASFAFDGCMALAPLIEGRFPQWRDVVPLNNHHRVEFPVAELKQALKAVLPAATDESRACRFTFDGQRIDLRCGLAQTGNASASCRATDDTRRGKGVSEISLDPGYFLEYLDSLPKDTCHATLAMQDDISVVLLMAEGQGQYILMPLAPDEPAPGQECDSDAEPEPETDLEPEVEFEPDAAEAFLPSDVVHAVRQAVDYFAGLNGLPFDRSSADADRRRDVARIIRTLRSNPFGRNVLRAQVAQGAAAVA